VSSAPNLQMGEAPNTPKSFDGGVNGYLHQPMGVSRLAVIANESSYISGRSCHWPISSYLDLVGDPI
jgi:hypothetical protein